MTDPHEADEFVATAHRHYDVMRESVDALADRIKEGARHMTSWGSQTPGASDTSTATTTITIDDVRAMVGKALRGSELPTDRSTAVVATLTTKVVKMDEAGVGLKFAICGATAGAGIQRTSGSTQSVTITFDPTRAPPEAAESDGASERPEPDGSRLEAELDALAATIGRGALPWSTAEVDLDFTFDDQAKASIIADGDISDSSTHHLHLVFTTSPTAGS